MHLQLERELYHCSYSSRYLSLMSVTSPYDTCCTCGSKADPGSSLRRCSRCKLALYCVRPSVILPFPSFISRLQGTGCQNASWKLHKRICKPREITFSNPTEELAGVRLLGGFNRPFYPSKTTVPPNHPVWTTGTVSPLSQIVGIPLLIHRELEEQPLETPNVADKDNQAVTYLMIDPESGYASAR